MVRILRFTDDVYSDYLKLLNQRSQLRFHPVSISRDFDIQRVILSSHCPMLIAYRMALAHQPYRRIVGLAIKLNRNHLLLLQSNQHSPLICAHHHIAISQDPISTFHNAYRLT